VSAAGFALLGAAAPAQATQHYIAFVDYYSDASYSTLVGSRTWNDCYGEEGTWGWGLQTAYHITTSEPCP
jgi:hypothetical protein